MASLVQNYYFSIWTRVLRFATVLGSLYWGWGASGKHIVHAKSFGHL